MTNLLLPPVLVLARLRFWLAIVALAVVSAASAQTSPVRNIDVVYENATYVVNAEMYAPVSQDVVWEVLTDFANMQKWVPNVVESRIVKPGEKQLTVEQHGNAKFAGLSFGYTSQREMVLNPQQTIQATQVKGSLRKMQSLMTLSPEAGGTKMQYRLEVVPNFLAATVMSPDFLKHEINEQFTAIVGEMLKRKK